MEENKNQSKNQSKWSTFVAFWLSQAVSQLGSSMTGYALNLWVFSKTHSAMTLSLMSFWMYLPYIIVSVFAGSFIDRYKKKQIMLVTDTIAAINTVFILVMLICGRLEIYHIYLVNVITGIMNAFQIPASTVAIGMIVPEGKYEKASGMSSFSGSLLTIATPVIATFIYTMFGLKGVIFVDLTTFIFAFFVLAFLIHIPENIKKEESKKQSVLDGTKEGWKYLINNKGIYYLVLSMTCANLFSRIGYENILPPLILARSNEETLALVTGFIGVGSIIGGLLVSIIKFPKSRMKVVYGSTVFSFLAGDLLMGISRNAWMWCLSAVVTSVLIPFINAGMMATMYERVPQDKQGRVFSIQNALQQGSIPIGILLGGYLADYVFEPFMRGTSPWVHFFERIVGTGTGNGMAVMFLFTGAFGALCTGVWYFTKEVQTLENNKVN